MNSRRSTDSTSVDARPFGSLPVQFDDWLVRILGAGWRRRATSRALRRCAIRGIGTTLQGTAWIHGPGRVELGQRVRLDGESAPIELHALAGGTISVGDETSLAGGCSIEATQLVSIGARSSLGPFVKVLDNNFHEIHGDRHRRPPARPVIVEDDVSIGEHAILLPGAHLSRHCRVAPYTVVGRAEGSSSEPEHALGPEHPVDHRTLQAYLGHVAEVAWAKLLFRDCELGPRVAAEGFVRVEAQGAISIGAHTHFLFGVVPTAVLAQRAASVRLGAECLVNYGVTIEAHGSVVIGDRCLLGDQVRVLDTDRRGTSPIVIEDDVWLAYGVTVEPGVTIGSGSVVAAGSRVSCNVPARSLARGDPAVVSPLKASRRAPGS